MRPDSSGLATLISLYVLIKQVKLLKKRTFKSSFFFRKQLKSESLAEVRFVSDSCCLVSQSNYLNNSNKECDRLILACFIREQNTPDATFTPLENKIWFENSANAWGNRPYSYSRYWTGTSLQVRLMRGSLFKCKLHSTLFNDIPPNDPPLHASSSPIPRIRIYISY